MDLETAAIASAAAAAAAGTENKDGVGAATFGPCRTSQPLA